MMEAKICKYCDKPIDDEKYIFMYFANEALHFPVHDYHIQAKREVKNVSKPDK